MPGTSEDNIALHRCHRTHRRTTSIEGGTIPANKEETQSMQCNNMMHAHDMANMMLIELMPLATILNEVGLNPRFKFKPHMLIFKGHSLSLS